MRKTKSNEPKTCWAVLPDMQCHLVEDLKLAISRKYKIDNSTSETSLE